MSTSKDSSKTLPEWQQWIDHWVKDQGWQKNNIFELYFLFQEEIGELTQALRAREKYHLEKEETRQEPPKADNLEEELADVFMYLIDIANFYQVDLETALARKIEKNSQRKWN